MKWSGLRRGDAYMFTHPNADIFFVIEDPIMRENRVHWKKWDPEKSTLVETWDLDSMPMSCIVIRNGCIHFRPAENTTCTNGTTMVR